MNEHVIGTLTLNGEGQVKARPDLATVQLGVQTRAKTAQEAAAKNAERMTAVIARIRAVGVPADDLQTAGFSISPVMDWKEGSPTYGQVVEYLVEDALNVKAGVDLAGKVLDEGISGGANVAGGLSFGLRDEAPYRQRALAAAVRAASADADLVSREMGVTLRGARTAEVVYGGSPVVLRAAKSDRAATPIEAGSIMFTASVRVVFEYQR